MMIINKILDSFHEERTINAETVNTIQNNKVLRKDLIDYFRQNQDREFALALLDKFISIRKSPDGVMPFEDLMLACYILGLHNHIEDCLKIWEAKTTDFDTYCGLDIQLIGFAGIKETIDFLKKQSAQTELDPLEYVTGCYKGGDFDDLAEYFSPNKSPWFL